MSVEMALWQVAGQNLIEVPSAHLDDEQRLEDWVADDPSILGMDIPIVGRQVQTPLGGRIDLLGLDRDANCVGWSLSAAELLGR